MFDKVSKSLSSVLPSNKVNIFGHDSLMMSAIPYYMLTVITLVAFWLHLRTQNPFIALFIIYSFIPLLDQLFSIDARNPNRDQYYELERSGFKYELPIYLTIIVDWTLFIYSLYYYQHFELTLTSWPLLIGFIVVIFNINAAQFAVAHEIMHKPGIRRVVGTWHMLKTLNIHFTSEHVFGHHRNVATPQDPASAEKGINVYKFFIRSYFGAYPKVYERDKADGKPFWKNTIFISIVANLAFCSAIVFFFGFQSFFCFLIQVFGAVFYLEVINYIEHYGLRRKKNTNGEYEKVTVRHSWNSAHRFSNYLFFKLQRHSDHHENAMKPYQTLLTIDEAAQLPHGYIIMTVMALFPSTFFRIMDPLVDHYAKYQTNNEKMKQIYAKSVYETKEFIIKISLWTTVFFVLSQILM